MQKEKKTTPQMAIAAFEQSCNELARQVNHRLFDDTRSWYWIGNEIGGSCDFDDADILTPEEMVIILQTPHFTYNDYAEWRDANIEYGDTKGYINLRSWIIGCRHFMLADKAKKETMIEPSELRKKSMEAFDNKCRASLEKIQPALQKTAESGKTELTISDVKKHYPDVEDLCVALQMHGFRTFYSEFFDSLTVYWCFRK